MANPWRPISPSLTLGKYISIRKLSLLSKLLRFGLLSKLCDLSNLYKKSKKKGTMLLSDTHLPCCPLTLDGVPYIDPVLHMRRLSVLGARPPVMSSPPTSSACCVVPSVVTFLMTSTGGDAR